MQFQETGLAGAYLIHLDPIKDHRGYNARAWCAREFESHGLTTRMVQTNVIYNHQRGTLRGLHYQLPPHQEAKLFRCTRGSLFDVIVDLRKDSPTYRQSFSVVLSSDQFTMLYVPQDFAQGFLTLEDHTELTYQVSEFYAPAFGRGISYQDPSFDFNWPIDVSVISDQDRNWPPFQS